MRIYQQTGIAMCEMVICLALYFLGTQMNYETFL